MSLLLSVLTGKCVRKGNTDTVAVATAVAVVVVVPAMVW